MIVTLETQLIWYGREYEPGEQVELPDIEAKRFIERGMAMPVVAAPPVEVAALPTYDKGRNHATRNATTRAKS